MPDLLQGSINDTRERLIKATEKKMVALELYSEILGEYDKIGFDKEHVINDDGVTIEIMIGGDTTVCAEDGNVVIDHDYNCSIGKDTYDNICFKVPINDKVVENVIMVLKTLTLRE